MRFGWEWMNIEIMTLFTRISYTVCFGIRIERTIGRRGVQRRRNAMSETVE